MTNATDDFAGKIDSSALDSDAVQEQLKLILTNPEFTANQRRKDFLSYVVEETLAGRSERLKGYSIAVSVYERNENFNADADPVVRLEARRLRRELEHYYLTSGRRDPIKISIPKGAYVPVFEMQAPQVPERADVGPAEPQPLPPKPQKITPTAIALVSAVAALALIGSIAFLVLFDPPAKEPAATAAGPWGDVPVVAVLPFDALGESASVKQAASGLAEDVITDLTRVAGLRVIAYPSATRLKAPAEDLRKLGADLSITHVLRGNLQVMPEGFRLNASLVGIETLAQAWAGRFDYRFDEQFDTQTKIARQISEALSVQLLPSEAARLSGGRWGRRDAQYLFQQALAVTNPPNDPSRFEAAVTMLERVRQLEPEAAHADGGLAYVESIRIWFGHRPNSEQARRRTEDHAVRAIANDPSNAHAYMALSMSAMNGGDHAQSVTHARKALEVQPSSSYAHAHLGVALTFAGKAEDAVGYIEMAIRLDPLNPRLPFRNMLTVARFHAGDYLGAIDATQSNLTKGGPFGPHMMVYLAASYAALGRNEEEQAILRQMKRTSSNNGAFSTEGWLRRAAHSEAQIKPLLDEIEKMKRIE